VRHVSIVAGENRFYRLLAWSRLSDFSTLPVKLRVMNADNRALYDRLETEMSETLTSTEWSLTETPDGYCITLSERTVTITAREDPTGTRNWVFTLLAEGETVGKFGPFDTIDSLVEQVSTVFESDSLYTVCCDSTPE